MNLRSKLEGGESVLSRDGIQRSCEVAEIHSFLQSFAVSTGGAGKSLFKGKGFHVRYSGLKQENRC